MPEPHVHMPYAELHDAIDNLRRTTFTAAAIQDLQSRISGHIQHPPDSTTEPHVHVPLSVFTGALSFLRGEGLPGGISNLEGILTKYTRREPGPGMTEVRAQALYEAVRGYEASEKQHRPHQLASGQWTRICHIMNVIEKGGTL